MSEAYISDTIEVSKTAPFELDVVKRLGVVANTGWITNDDGTIYIRINDRGAAKITLHVDESLDFRKEDDWNIKSIYITTDSVSSLTVRYMFRYLPIRIIRGGVKSKEVLDNEP